MAVAVHHWLEEAEDEAVRDALRKMQVRLCVCVYVELAWVGLVVVTVPSPSIDQSIHSSTHLPTHGNRTRWRRW